MIRLQKFMAEAGVASRRECEKFIAEGRVKINGKIAAEPGLKINPLLDEICFDDEIIFRSQKKIYITLNKPPGYITAVKDARGEKTVMDLLKGVRERVYPVGRLDRDTSGLLILTNDGDFACEIMRPKNGIKKTYIATVKGAPSEEALAALKTGIVVDGYKTAPADVKVLKTSFYKSVLKITITEGKNRQIRKMCAAVGCGVSELKRIRIGGLSLGALKEGEYKILRRRPL
jgi:23S rRNA pseudouridine2605 synthase